MKLAYRFEATLTEVVPIGLVPEGIRNTSDPSHRITVPC